MPFDFFNDTYGIPTNGSRFDNGLTNAENWLVLVGGLLGCSLFLGLLLVAAGRCSDAAERAGTVFFCCRRCHKKGPAEQDGSEIDEKPLTDNNPNSPSRKVSAGVASSSAWSMASSPLLGVHTAAAVNSSATAETIASLPPQYVGVASSSVV